METGKLLKQLKSIPFQLKNILGSRLVDVGTEWRSFSNEKSGNDPSRVGAPESPYLSGGDLSTSIAVGFGGSDSDNTLANAQRKTMNNTDRQMTTAMNLIREMSERVHLPRNIQVMFWFFTKITFEFFCQELILKIK